MWWRMEENVASRVARLLPSLRKITEIPGGRTRPPDFGHSDLESVPSNVQSKASGVCRIEEQQKVEY